MENLKSNLVSFLKDEEGLTVIEYVLGAALIVAALGAIFTTLGDRLDNKLSNTMNSLDGAGS
ncbi:Flp family type IVb pilin [Vibrio breoganii]|uniref:Flp family type IVb pilin n=1 Tax=Vibrio breoganii TaxID=553239 RepID=UPI000C831A61|nr:fimbrial protein [Vibrio breoganii]PML12894.1 fimbrial protein [Vibrio breoganii]PML28631.1 fimbrial protein [Vibrio breoganii]PML35726.1 fimbrial protein [Vibrio breoganii]PMM84880.1 fimbrial protein [Vibrio breoganii]